MGVGSECEGPNWRRARQVLAIAVAGGCLGLAWRALRAQGPVADWLFLATGCAPEQAVLIERSAGWILLALVPAILVRRWWWCLPAIGLWTLWSSYAQWWDASGRPGLVWGAHAIRHLAPLALLVMSLPAVWRQRLDAARTVPGLLRLGLGLTFCFHGLEAWLLEPVFFDYLSGAWMLLGLQPDHGHLAVALRMIAVWDLAIGLGLLLGARGGILYAAAAWALATAGVRVVDAGWYALPETLLRLIHVGPALTLILLARAPARTAIPGDPHVRDPAPAPTGRSALA